MTNTRINADEAFTRQQMLLVDPFETDDFEPENDPSSLDPEVQQALWSVYYDARKVAFDTYRRNRAALSSAFDAEIDKIYADPMAYPFDLRCAAVDRLVKTYHEDRARLILNRRTAIEDAQASFEAAVKTLKGEL